MHKLNNKGYMLVEIILASVIAFGVAYFIINLTIKLKNKNDDLFVDTEIGTDRAIISNKLMDYIKDEKEAFDCSKLTKGSGNTIEYKGNIIDTVNENTDIEPIICVNDTDSGVVNVAVPLEVKQMADKDYDVKINYYYKIEDSIQPSCKLKKEGSNIVFEYKEDNIAVTQFGLVKGTTKAYNSVDSISLAGAVNGTEYTGFVKDALGNEGTCIYVYTSAPSCALTVDLWHYGADLVVFYYASDGWDSITLTATDQSGNAASGVTIYETDDHKNQYAASLSGIGFSPVKYTATVNSGAESGTCSIYMAKKNTVTYTRTAYPCLYNSYYCYLESYYNQYTNQYFCDTERGGRYCPEVVVNGKPGCCQDGVSYGQCYGWIPRKEIMNTVGLSFQRAYDYVTTETSCTPVDFTCDAEHEGQWKVECSEPSGQACPDGYSEVGNYCFKY